VTSVIQHVWIFKKSMFRFLGLLNDNKWVLRILNKTCEKLHLTLIRLGWTRFYGNMIILYYIKHRFTHTHTYIYIYIYIWG
jgi:hypothetical protein